MQYQKQAQRPQLTLAQIREISERNRALRQVEQDVADVEAIYADLARIVHEQAEPVRQAEENVEHTRVYVEEGHKDVKQAVMYRQSSCRKKLICFLLFLFLVVILITVILIVVSRALPSAASGDAGLAARQPPVPTEDNTSKITTVSR